MKKTRLTDRPFGYCYGYWLTKAEKYFLINYLNLIHLFSFSSSLAANLTSFNSLHYLNKSLLYNPLLPFMKTLTRIQFFSPSEPWGYLLTDVLPWCNGFRSPVFMIPRKRCHTDRKIKVVWYFYSFLSADTAQQISPCSWSTVSIFPAREIQDGFTEHHYYYCYYYNFFVVPWWTCLCCFDVIVIEVSAPGWATDFVLTKKESKVKSVFKIWNGLFWKQPRTRWSSRRSTEWFCCLFSAVCCGVWSLSTRTCVC